MRKEKLIIIGNIFFQAISFLIGLLLINYLFIKYPKNIDLTSIGKYTLNEQTINIVKNLKEKVKIMIFFSASDPITNEIIDILKEYKKYSNNIEVEIIDPEKNPGKINLYKVNAGTIIFLQKNKRKDVSIDDLFEVKFEENTGKKIPYMKTEYIFTSAILEITGKKEYKCLFTTGHNEKSIEENSQTSYSLIKQDIVRENFIVNKINLLAKDIDNGCSLVIIAAPDKPFHPVELGRLNKFINKGGNLFILLEPFNKSNINEILKKFNLQETKKLVIEPSPSMHFPSDPATLIPRLIYSDITRKIIDKGLSVIFPGACEIKKLNNNDTMINIKPLMVTSGSGFSVSDLSAKIKLDTNKKTGGIHLGFLAVNKNKHNKLIVLSDSDFAANANKLFSANTDLFLNSVNFLFNKKSNITIRPKKIDVRPIELSSKQFITILILTALVLPLFIILLGIVIYFYRKKL